MKSYTDAAFWELYDKLPAAAQKQADKGYEQFKINPFHQSLHFKHIGHDVWSVRAGSINYRALGLITDKDTIIWFWIGSHADYDKEIRKF